MPSTPNPSGALIVREYKGTPFYEVAWRDSTRRQRKRRLGRAWLKQSGEGWARRRGRPEDGYLDERSAYLAMTEVIEEDEQELAKLRPAQREATFADAARAWLDYVQYEKRVKPSTLRRHRTLLREASSPVLPRTPRRGRKPLLTPARIMREFGERRLVAITTDDIRRFLSELDREEITARTVNIYRQVLHSIFEYARRGDAFGLAENPVAATNKRPEDAPRPVETFEPHEVRAIAAAARAGEHRTHGGYSHSTFSAETEREWQRINDQDAAIFIIAACTGLRLGETCALRWSDLDLKDSVMIVSRAMSAGEEMSTKSRRTRSVPLSEQALVELRGLRKRDHFTARSDFVFCRPDGGPIDRTTLRKRFIRAQEEAGLRVRRFHDLRHTFGSLAIRRFDLVAVKNMMGHSKLSTTERYLHSKPRPDDALKLTEIFNAEESEDEEEAA
jgi:integrase